jgi:hypothetical protein
MFEPNKVTLEKNFAAQMRFAGLLRASPMLFVLFILEVVVFYAELGHQITPFFPMNFDQTVYINQVYELYSNVVDGAWEQLYRFFRFPNPTGLSLLLQGVVAAVIGGANRTSLLTLNLVYFLALQLIVFLAVRARTYNADFGWIAIALLIGCVSLFNVAGGIFDFRFDFCAFCLFGIWASLIVWSRVFRDRRLTIVAALVAASMVLTRFVTLAYVSVILGVILAIFLWNTRSSKRMRSAFAKLRIRHWILCVAISALLPSPILIPAALPFFEYYVGAHVSSADTYMRAAEVGVFTFEQHMTFYPRSIWFDHLGTAAICLGIMLLTTTALVIGFRKAPLKLLWRGIAHFRYELATLVVIIVVPIVILTLDITKSTVVGGIIIAPIVLAVTLIAAGIWYTSPIIVGVSSPSDRMSHTGLQISTVQLLAVLRFVLVAGGLMAFLLHSTANQHLISRLDLDRINEMNFLIARYAVEHRISHVQFSIDRVIDYANPFIVTLTAYERFNAHLTVQYGLGRFYASMREEAMAFADESDVLVLTDPLVAREAPYPVNTAIQEYWNDLLLWATKNRQLLHSTTITGIPYRVFVRPQR